MHKFSTLYSVATAERNNEAHRFPRTETKEQDRGINTYRFIQSSIWIGRIVCLCVFVHVFVCTGREWGRWEKQGRHMEEWTCYKCNIRLPTGGWSSRHCKFGPVHSKTIQSLASWNCWLSLVQWLEYFPSTAWVKRMGNLWQPLQAIVMF